MAHRSQVRNRVEGPPGTNPVGGTSMGMDVFQMLSKSGATVFSFAAPTSWSFSLGRVLPGLPSSNLSVSNPPLLG